MFLLGEKAVNSVLGRGVNRSRISSNVYPLYIAYLFCVCVFLSFKNVGELRGDTKRGSSKSGRARQEQGAQRQEAKKKGLESQLTLIIIGCDAPPIK